MYLIRPRKHDPTHYYRYEMGFIPWWVKIPYRIVRFIYLLFVQLSEGNAPGLFKLMVPLAAFHVIYSFGELWEHGPFSVMGGLILITYFLGIILLFINEWAKRAKRKGVLHWNRTRGHEHDSQYHSEEGFSDPRT